MNAMLAYKRNDDRSILLHFLIACWALTLIECKNLIQPEFQSVPSKTVYYDTTSNDPVRLACTIWPPQPFGHVSYYTAIQSVPSKGQTNPRWINPHSPFYPIPTEFLCHPNRTTESENPMLCFSNSDSIRQLSGRDIYCLARTDFGTLLSHPFEVVRSESPTSSVERLLPDNWQSLTTKTKVHLLEFFQGNMAIVPCQNPIESRFQPVHFNLNGTRLANLSDKYRIVKDPSINLYYLLIRDFQSSDEGLYDCVPTGLARQWDWTDVAIRYQLKRKVSSLPSNPHLVKELAVPFSGSQPTRSGTPEARLVIDEDSSVSLFCLFESVPFVSSRITVPVSNEQSRYRFDDKFGVLTIDHVTLEDEGRFTCSADKVTSSVFVQVRRKLRVTVNPEYVSQPVGASVNLSCLSSNSQLTPTWYFNGFAKLSQSSSGSNSLLVIRALKPSDFGIYQCIVRNSDGSWASATVIVHQPEDSILTKADFDLIQSKSPNSASLNNATVTAHPGDSITLDCIPARFLQHPGSSSWVNEFLANLLPGSGPMEDQLNLSYALGYLRVVWRKDQALLQLPHHTANLFRLNLTLVQSHDFGAYECQIFAESNLIWNHLTVVQSDTANSPDLVPNSSNSALGHIQPAAAAAAPVAPTTSDLQSHWPSGLPDHPPSFDSSDLNLALLNHASSRDFDEVDEEFGSYDKRGKRGTNRRPNRNRLVLETADRKGNRLKKPNASAVGDNLAVLIEWSSIPTDFYRIQLRSRSPMSDGWTARVTINEMIKECCLQDPNCCTQNKHSYLTSRQPGGLEPGQTYQVRVQAIRDNVTLDKSPWSDPISFEHISKVAPVITETERMPNGRMLARWTLATSAVGFPIDHFLLLYRPEERLPGGKITYNGFKAVYVPGADTREYQLESLEPGKGYQIVIYGVQTPPGIDPQATIFTGGLHGRRITQFSHEVFVKPRGASTVDQPDSGTNSALSSVAKSRENLHTHDTVAFNSAESNRLMFLILGALAGLMLFIMICLVILCVWRQKRDKHRLMFHHPTGPGLSESTSLDASKHLIKKGNNHHTGFLLNHLNNSSTHPNMTQDLSNPNGMTLSEKSTLIHRHPPPISPAPPPPPSSSNPPVLSNQYQIHSHENLELVNLIADYAQQYHHHHHYPNPMPQRAASYHPHHSLDRIELTSQLQQQQRRLRYSENQSHPMMFDAIESASQMGRPTSPYFGGHLKNASNYPIYLTSSNLPIGLKREPPSGGSVHDGTDDECTVLDKDLTSSRRSSDHMKRMNINNDRLSQSMLRDQSFFNNPYPKHFSSLGVESGRQLITSSPMARPKCRTQNFEPMNHDPTYFVGSSLIPQSGMPIASQLVPNYDPGLTTPSPPIGNVACADTGNGYGPMVMMPPYSQPPSRRYRDVYNPQEMALGMDYRMENPNSIVSDPYTKYNESTDHSLRYFGLGQPLRNSQINPMFYATNTYNPPPHQQQQQQHQHYQMGFQSNSPQLTNSTDVRDMDNRLVRPELFNHESNPTPAVTSHVQHSIGSQTEMDHLLRNVERKHARRRRKKVPTSSTSPPNDDGQMSSSRSSNARTLTPNQLEMAHQMTALSTVPIHGVPNNSAFQPADMINRQDCVRVDGQDNGTQASAEDAFGGNTRSTTPCHARSTAHPLKSDQHPTKRLWIASPQPQLHHPEAQTQHANRRDKRSASFDEHRPPPPTSLDMSQLGRSHAYDDLNPPTDPRSPASSIHSSSSTTHRTMMTLFFGPPPNVRGVSDYGILNVITQSSGRSSAQCSTIGDDDEMPQLGLSQPFDPVLAASGGAGSELCDVTPPHDSNLGIGQSDVLDRTDEIVIS